MGETLKRDVRRWLDKFMRGAIDPDTWDEIEGWTTEKVREWEGIVRDM